MLGAAPRCEGLKFGNLVNETILLGAKVIRPTLCLIPTGKRITGSSRPCAGSGSACSGIKRVLGLGRWGRGEGFSETGG